MLKQDGSPSASGKCLRSILKSSFPYYVTILYPVMRAESVDVRNFALNWTWNVKTNVPHKNTPSVHTTRHGCK